MHAHDLRLLPSPRTVETIPGLANLDAAPRIERDIQALGRLCEYEILCNDSLTIRAGNEAGVVAAKHTLRQIQVSARGQLCAFRVHDWASFKHRGFMLDVSRDRIPTMPELKDLVALLASLKYNHLQLYIEHTFAYAGHEAIWSDLDPITPEQMKQLDTWCQDAGIQLAANQNCFGHLRSWLSHPSYQHLAETHNEFEFFGMPRTGPFSLNPTNSGSLELVEDWINQLRSCHTSNTINIGCDETADVGSGGSSSAVAELGFARVYSDFVNKVAHTCHRNGMNPMFWADIAISKPESLAMLGPSLTALVWGYEPDSPFDQALTKLNDHGFTSWVCPGTSCWRSFTGRTSERLANIQAAADAGIRNSCDGFLLTAWGDLGHRQQWPITLRAIGDGAQAAWAGTGSASHESCDLHLFKSPNSGISNWLDTLGDADHCLRRSTADLPLLLNASALFHELHPAHPSQPSRGTLKQWIEIRSTLNDLADSIPTHPSRQIDQELKHAHRCAALAADTAILRRGGDAIPDLESVIAEHESLWLKRSRPAGLPSSSAYYRSLSGSLEVPS